jgi:tetratricopeptide (TPR) repeat protein
MRTVANLEFFYHSFFQSEEITSKKLALRVATILHYIAKVHHQQHEYGLAMSSYHASLRGMKLVNGRKHQLVAAILGNIGNLLKDMKEYDRAYDTYQSALKIESLRLGYSHTSVLLSMLKIASIENVRGRHDESIALYKEVIMIHKSRHHGDKSAVDILIDAYSSLGDVYERIGHLGDAIVCYKDALEIHLKTFASLHSGAGKLLHKLGILCSENAQFEEADSYFKEALALFELCSITDERVIQVERDKADNIGKMAFVK